MRLAQLAEQLQRGRGVGRAFHVDPQPAAVGAGRVGERAQVADAQLGIDIEAQLRRLDGDLALHPAGLDALERDHVMRQHGIGFGLVGDVLAQVRERHRESELVLLGRGDQRLVERLARHEPADGQLHELAARGLALEPGTAGTSEQQAAHGIHGRARGWMRVGTAGD